MKRLLLLLGFLLSLAPTWAATVSGTITNASTPGSVSGYKIYMIDSAGTTLYRDSTFSNSSGGYSFTLPTAFTSGPIFVYTYACGGQSGRTITYNGASSVTINFSICPINPSAYWVTDTVRNMLSNTPVRGQKVYILDSTATRFQRDSGYTNQAGVVFLPVASNVTPGNLRIYTIAPCGSQSQTVAFNYQSFTAPTLYICANSPIISGVITNLSNNTAIPYQKVVVEDSFGTARFFADSTYADGSGNYSIGLPLTVPGHKITASAFACGSRKISSATFTSANLNLNLGLCATSLATWSGIVYNGNSTSPLAGRKLYLIDSINQTTIHIDSLVTGSNGAYSFTIPPRLVQGRISIWAVSCGTLEQLSVFYYQGSSRVENLHIYTGAPTTFSGTIRNTNGTPASGIQVFVIQNGSLQYSAGAITASNGTYSFNLPCSWSASTLYFYMPMPSCGTRNSRAIPYNGVSIVWNDTMCAPIIPPVTYTYGFGGRISKQGSGSASSAKVWIIDEFYDSVALATSLYAMDSTVTNSSGQYFFGWNSYPGGAHPGKFMRRYLKAALQATDPSYSSFLPTYKDSALNWSLASTLGPGVIYQQPTNVDFSLRGGSNPGGPGFIGGNVLLGANKTAGVGDPLAARIIILTNISGKPVGYAYSDARGSFSFPNLAYGSYYLFGDAPGLSNPKFQVTISAAKPRVTDVVFDENSTTFAARFGTVGVGLNPALDALRLFPNPAGHTLNLNGLAAIAGAKTIVIRNVNGVVCSRHEIAAGTEPQVQLGNIPAGMYLLEVRTQSGVQNLRFIKE